MQFSRRDEFYQVSHITGPKHNFLALAIMNNRSANSAPIITSLPSVGQCLHPPLNQQQILRAVMEGVSTANTRFGTQFAVQRVQYLANDTGPEGLYGVLALKLIERLVLEGSFEDTGFPLGPQQ